MNLQITNPIYPTKMSTPIVSQGARASSKDMPHEVFFITYSQSNSIEVMSKYSLVSYVSCAKSFSFILIYVRLDFL